jgi:hypothetical protein
MSQFIKDHFASVRIASSFSRAAGLGRTAAPGPLPKPLCRMAVRATFYADAQLKEATRRR